MNVDTVHHSRGDDGLRPAERAGSPEISAILAALSRGRFIIASWAILLSAAVFVVVCLIPGRYRADATVLVQPVADAAGPNPATIQVPPEIVRSQLEVVHSPPVLTRVVTRLGLMNDPEFAPPAWLKPGADARLATVLANVEKRLTVDNDGRSVTIRISFDASSPSKAQRIVNEVADEYIRAANDLKNRAVALTASRLEKRLSDLRSDAMRAEDAAEDFRRSVKLVQLAPPTDEDAQLGSSTYTSRLLDQFSRQAAEISATAEQAQARAQIAGSDMARTGGVNTPEILSSPVIATYQQRDAELAATEASMALRYTRDYPPLVQLRAQRARLSRALLATRSSIKRSLDMQAVGARVADRAAVNRAGALEQLVSRQTTDAVHYRQLRREAATKRKIYEDLADRAGAISERSLLQLPDAVLVSPASLPIRESWPNRPMFFVVGFVLSLLVGCAMAVIGELRRVPRGRGADSRAWPVTAR